MSASTATLPPAPLPPAPRSDREVISTAASTNAAATPTLRVPGQIVSGGGQSSLGVSVMAIRAVTRLQMGVRRSHLQLARRLGIGFIACTIIHNATLVILFISEVGGGGLYAEMTHAISISAFMFHIALALPYCDMRGLLYFHYGLVAINSAIRGGFDVFRGKHISALWNLVWLLCLYPIGGWGLKQFLRTVHEELRATTMDAVSHSAVVSFTVSAMPIIYFFLNAMSCFEMSTEQLRDEYCAVRIYVNRTAIFTILGSAVSCVMLTIQPLSLVQITRVDIPILQLCAFGFHGLLLLLAIAIHSQNEMFGTVMPAVAYMYQGVAPCFLGTLVAFSASIVTKRKGSDENVKVTVRSTPQLGKMIPHRAVMVLTTVVYDVLVICRAGDAIRHPFAPLSYAAACFHVWVTMEDASVALSVKWHYLAHACSDVFRGVLALCTGDRREAFIMLCYVLFFYPGNYLGLVRFRASVRARGESSATNGAASSLIAFWCGVVPPMLYLGADSIGWCALSDVDEQQCENRQTANFIGAAHVLCLFTVGTALTSTEGGFGLSVITAMQLEFSRPELLAGGLIATASAIALFIFSIRESDEDFTNVRDYVSRVFMACWLFATLILLVHLRSSNALRVRRCDPSRAQRSAGSAAIVVLPCAWSYVLTALSFISYSAPAIIRSVFFVETLRGVRGGISNLSFVAHCLMLATHESTRARMVLVAHFLVHLTGAVGGIVADAQSAEFTLGMALVHFISMGGVAFELWIWIRVLQPMLIAKNRALHDGLPIVAFRWLFQKGGLMMSLYVFFEAIGVGLDSDLSAKDIAPWQAANAAVIIHVTLAAVLEATLIADANISLGAVLRGAAPLCLTVGLAVLTLTSLIALALFAGREFCGGDQEVLYSTLFVVFLLLWVLTFGVVAAGHSSRGSEHTTATDAIALPGEGEDEEQRRRRASFSELSGAGIAPGI